MPVFIYIAWYCMHKILKKEIVNRAEIHLCNKNLNLDINNDFVENLDRGQLKFPKEHLINAILYNYVVINKLRSTFKSDFLKLKDHHKIILSITSSILDNNDFLSEESCEKFHTIKNILKKVLFALINIFFILISARNVMMVL